MNAAGTAWMQAGAQAAAGGMGLMFKRAGVNYDNRKQYAQQEKLSNLQISNESRLMDIQNQKQLEMWEKTGYGAQVDQMERAGLNPALIYGGGGAGGQSMGQGMPSVATATAENPRTSEGAEKAMGMGIQGMLMKAQIDNINADTKNKLEGAGEHTASAEGKNLANALEALLQGTDLEGKDTSTGEKSIGANSIKAQQAIGDAKMSIDENQRRELMNDPVIKEIRAKIELMGEQGKQAKEMVESIKRDVKLKDTEIKFNEMGVSKGDFGKFIIELIKNWFKRGK